MFHLSAGNNCVIRWYVCFVHDSVRSVEVLSALFVLLFMHCQDVPSFSRIQWSVVWWVATVPGGKETCSEILTTIK